MSENNINLKLGKQGNYNTGNVSGGIKREQLKTNEQKAIFDLADKNKDGVLTNNEMAKFNDEILAAAKGGKGEKLSKGEARRYLKDQGVHNADGKHLKGEGLHQFLQELETLSANSNIEEAYVDEQTGETVLISNGGATKEVINSQNNTSYIQNESEDGTLIENFENKVLVSEEFTDNDGNVSFKEFDESENPVKETITAKGGTPVTVINYENGEPAIQTVTNGTTVEQYSFVDGEPVLTSKVENKGLEAKEKTTAFTYNEDGTVTENITEYGKTTEIIRYGETVLRETIKEGNVTTEKTLQEDGTTLEVINDGEGNIVNNTLNAEGHRLYQSKRNADGKEYYIEYDGQGNTAVTVQNGESIALLAKRFGCTTQEIIDANSDAVKGKKGSEYFYVGAEIKIPRELEADRPQLQGRNSADVEIGEYQAFIAERDARLRAEQQPEELSGLEQAMNNRATGRVGQTVSGAEGVTFSTDNDGNVYYFDAEGNLIDGEARAELVKKEVETISNTLYDAAHYPWGTDEKALTTGIDQIYSKEIFEAVNTSLAAKDADYKPDANTTAVEKLILDEMSHKAARPLLKTLTHSGVMTVDQQANTVTRELEHEVKGGLSITRRDQMHQVMQLCPDRDTRLAVETKMKTAHPELQPNEGSYVRAYIDDDGFDAMDVDSFDANWVQNNSYTAEQDQEHRNGVIGRLVKGEYEGISNAAKEEALHRGLEVCDDNPESADYKNLTEIATAENAENGYKAQFKGQDAVQTFIAGRSTDNKGVVDIGEVSASNTLLFKGEKPERVQAEEALYNAKSGDFAEVFTSMEPDTYAAIETMLTNGEVDGVKNLQEAYEKAIAGKVGNEKIEITANAILSGKVEFSEKEIADFCVQLMHSIDLNEGQGTSTGVSAKHTNISEYQTAQLQAILQAHPEVLAEVKAQVEKGEFASTTAITTGSFSGGSTKTYSTDTKEKYLQILNDVKTIADEAIFYDENGNQITDAETIAAITEANKLSLSQMREYVAELEREFKMQVDREGALSYGANGLSRLTGIGTDRGDVENRYREAKNLLSQLEAAAEGKLRDSDGNVISVQDLAQSIIDKDLAAAEGKLIDSNSNLISVQDLIQTNIHKDLASTNADYNQTIQIGKMGIILTPVILATAGVSGVAVAKGWIVAGSAGSIALGATTAGATTYGLSQFELSTSETGNTRAARERARDEALVATASVGAGAAAMKVLPNAAAVILSKNPGLEKVTGLSAVIASDIGVGAAGEHVLTGDITVQGVALTAVFSVTGNLIAYRPKAKVDVDAPTSQRKYIDQITENNTKAPGGPLSKTNKQRVVAEVEAEAAQGMTPEQAVVRHEQGHRIQSVDRVPGRRVKHAVNDGVGVYESKKLGRFEIATETDYSKLNQARREVASWGNSPRRTAILEKLDNRIAQLAGDVELQATPVRSEVVEALNTSTKKQAAAVLDQQGGLPPHDAATLREQIMITDSVDDLLQMRAKLEKRTGTQVQGIDHARAVIHDIDVKVNQIRVRQADFNAVTRGLDDAIAAGRGLNEVELGSARNFLKNGTVDELSQVSAKLKQVAKKSTAVKQLIKDVDARISELNVDAALQAKSSHNRTVTEQPEAPIEGNTIRFEDALNDAVAAGRLNPDGTPVTPKVDDSAPAPSRVAEPEAPTPPEGSTIDFMQARRQLIEEGKLNPDGTPITPKGDADPAPVTGNKKPVADGDVDPVTGKKKVADADATGNKKPATAEETPTAKPDEVRNTVNDVDNAIQGAGMQKQQVSLWNRSKQQISKLVESFTNGVKNPKAFLAKGNELLKDLGKIAKNAPANIRAQITKLANQVKSMMQSVKNASQPQPKTNMSPEEMWQNMKKHIDSKNESVTQANGKTIIVHRNAYRELLGSTHLNANNEIIERVIISGETRTRITYDPESGNIVGTVKESINAHDNIAFTGKFKNLNNQLETATTARQLDNVENALRTMPDDVQKAALLERIAAKRTELAGK